MTNTICLNMIVKNESHIIEKTLSHLLDIIKFDYWVICDTGSTDNTKELITSFFNKHNIPGEIVEHKWVSFDVCRTYALNKAYGKSDYLFIFDADDSITGEFKLPNKLIHDQYMLKFGNENFLYHRGLLINNRKRWKFVGVLHEILVPLHDNSTKDTIQGNYFVNSGREGSRNKDPNKYLNDALLLEKSILSEKDDGLKNRYIYYCAQSFYDAGEYEKSLKYYKLVIENENWNQEKFIACLKIGCIYIHLSQPQNAKLYLTNTINIDSTRLEGFEALIEYSYNNKKHDDVIKYFNMIKHIKPTTNTNNYLFYNENSYYNIRYYVSVSAFSTNNLKCGYKCCKELVFNDKFCNDNILYNTLVFFKTEYNANNESDIQLLCLLYSKMIEYENNQKNILAKQIWNTISQHLKNYDINKYNNSKNIFENQIIVNDIYSKSKNILVYTGHHYQLWNQSDMNNCAIGGSEKAVIYLTNELSNLTSKKYNIYISGCVQEEKIDNINYVNRDNLQQLLNEKEFHTIIVSRYLDFFEIFKNIRCFKILLWMHDICLVNFNCNKSTEDVLKIHNDNIYKCVCLTNWHKKQTAEKYPILKDKIVTINNGIHPGTISKIKQESILHNIKKIRNSFIYSSCSERGLDVVLNKWKFITENIPGATLHICSYNKFPKNEFDQKLVKIINQYSNIKHYGRLDSENLYKLMNMCEYWYYPTYFAETSCITAMEMMANEVICIYYPVAGLVNTVGKYGVQVDNGNDLHTILKLVGDETLKANIRSKALTYIDDCIWSKRANVWCNLMFNNSPINNNEESIEEFNKNFKLNKSCKIYSALSFLKNKKDIYPKTVYVSDNISISNLHDFYYSIKDLWTEKSFPIFYSDFNHNNYIYSKLNFNKHKEKHNIVYDLIISEDNILDISSNPQSFMLLTTSKVENLNYENDIIIPDNSLFCKTKKQNKIAIFNGFTFHHEMYGCIFDYCNKHNINTIDIFFNNSSKLDWDLFYKQYFTNLNLNFINKDNFNFNNNYKYKFVFAVTDDDHHYKSEWVTHNTICFNHYYKIRNPIYSNYYNITKLNNSNNPTPYSNVCFDYINFKDKINQVNPYKIVVSVIGNIKHVNFNILEKLYSNHKQLVINLYSRAGSNIHNKYLNNPKYNIFLNIGTQTLMNKLIKSDYILYSYKTSFELEKINTSSGSLQLSLNTLSIPILDKCLNKNLNIVNCMEIDFNDDKILINKPDLTLYSGLEIERNRYIHNFHNYLKSFDILKKDIYKTYDNDIGVIINETIIDKNQKLECMNKYFNEYVLEAYNNLELDYYKKKLIDLCYFYINGGKNVSDSNTMHSNHELTLYYKNNKLTSDYFITQKYNPCLLDCIHFIVCKYKWINCNNDIDIDLVYEKYVDYYFNYKNNGNIKHIYL